MLFPFKVTAYIVINMSTDSLQFGFWDINIEAKSNTAESSWQNGTMSLQQSDCVFIFLWQISITEHLKQLTDAHRDFGLRHGEYNHNVIR